MSAKNTILSPVTPKSDNDGVNSGMGGESRSVNNALLILKTGKNMGNYHQDMDYGFYDKPVIHSLQQQERILLMTLQGAHKVQVLSSACHSHNLHKSARNTSQTTPDSCQWIPNGANKAQATYFTDLTYFISLLLPLILFNFT